MRKLLCIILSMAVMAGIFSGCSGIGGIGLSAFNKEKIVPDFTQANQRFAFDVFKQLNREDKGKNVFISPLSISTALSMVYQGAAKSTRDAMTRALRYDGISIDNINNGYQNLIGLLKQVDSKIELDIGNSIWIRQGEPIKEEFLTTNKKVFAAQVASLDFSKADAVDQINRWVSDSTKGKIPKIVEAPIPDEVIMYLINAIYFKGQWTEKFDKKKTVQGQFHNGDGKTSQAMMMNRNGKIEYGKGAGFKAVRLPYGKGKTAMYMILPDENIPVDKFVDDMQPDKWKAIRESLHETKEVILEIPRFKLEYGIKSLNDSLTALGMGEAFSDNADFSGIREKTRISQVLHKAVIEVNEEGSEAAAVTAVITKTTAALEPVKFIADRPFIFAIADDQTGTILFLGKLADVE